MNRTGSIQIYTGEGKGKTTAALGLAWRATGRGLRVYMVQFLKAPETSSEQLGAQAFGPMLTMKPVGRRGFIGRQGCSEQDILMARRGLEEARNAMLSGNYDIVILDEINVAVHLGVADLKAVLELMDIKPEKVELVLTGRYAHPEIIDRADYVLEMKKIKHHFDLGVEAREGIEF